MAFRRFVTAGLVAMCMSSVHAQSTANATDWATFSKFLSLLQVLMQAGAAACPDPQRGCDPVAAQKAIDDILDGKNADANVLMLEIFADMPPAERAKLLALGRSMASMARQQAVTQGPRASDVAAIRARKELTAMGLSYYDKGQFLDAVGRNDILAVRLFLTGRGVDSNVKDIWGNSAVDIARRNGNARMITLLSENASKP